MKPFSNYNSELKPLARKLRREMTPQERHLWYDFLKDFKYTVKRQRPIGPYIVDFYCDKAKLVIELGSSQHDDEEGRARDQKMDAYLRDLGFRVLRISNADVNLNFSGVCGLIEREIYNAMMDGDGRM